MPIPVSRTSKRSIASCGFSPSLSTSTVTWPCSVNLSALPIRFSNICRNRPGSPRNSRGTSGFTDTINSRPFTPGLIHHQFNRVHDRVVKIEIDLLESQFAGRDLGVGENVADEFKQCLTPFARVISELALF